MNILDLKIFSYESVDLARTFPDWNSPLLSVECIYIRTFKEVEKVKIKLEEKETEAEFFNSEMKMKWEKLKRRQLDFLADVRKYDKFFNENERKFKRISAKIAMELVIQKNYREEIDMLEERNKYLSAVLQKMENSVNTLLPYHEFLNALVANKKIEGMKDIEGLINTFVLLTSQKKLHDEFASSFQETEKLHSQMQQYMAIKQIALSKQTNDLFHARKHYNSEKENLLLLKNKLIRKKKELRSENEEDILVMKWSYDNIYRLLSKWKKVGPSSRLESTDNQKISFIGNAIDELRSIVKEAQELCDKSNLSCEADSSFMSVKRIV